jgi:hypothetical protein
MSGEMKGMLFALGFIAGVAYMLTMSLLIIG